MPDFPMPRFNAEAAAFAVAVTDDETWFTLLEARRWLARLEQAYTTDVDGAPDV